MEVPCSLPQVLQENIGIVLKEYRDRFPAGPSQNVTVIISFDVMCPQPMQLSTYL
jgi:hypothetical protein